MDGVGNQHFSARTIPVYAGSSRPLVDNPTRYFAWHGWVGPMDSPTTNSFCSPRIPCLSLSHTLAGHIREDGLGDAGLPDAADRHVEKEHASLALLRLCSLHQGQVRGRLKHTTVAELGCLKASLYL